MTANEERLERLERRIAELEEQLRNERAWRSRWWRGALVLVLKLCLSMLVAYLTAQGCAPSQPPRPRTSPPPIPAPRDSQGDPPP